MSMSMRPMRMHPLAAVFAPVHPCAHVLVLALARVPTHDRAHLDVLAVILVGWIEHRATSVARHD